MITPKRLRIIKARAIEGGHYAKWLYVPELISIVEFQRKVIVSLSLLSGSLLAWRIV